jgi:ubiquinone biosynthesis protein
MTDSLLLNEALLNSLGVDALVPPALAPWRPLVIEGLLYFLERLEPEHLAAIGEAQFALPEEAEVGQRLVALLSQCPTLHKLGQVLARHPAIPESLGLRLRELESMPSITPIAGVLERIRAELPPDAPVLLGDQALAEASVAIVVPFTYSDGTSRRHGVFKILKAGVAERLGQELAVWLELGDFLAHRGAELGLPALDYRGTLGGIAELIANEVKLEVEQTNLAAAAKFYAGDPRVLVPKLLPWCTPRMTAMERVFGTKVTAAPLGAAARGRLADSVISALLARPFWNRADTVFMHADPHAGNLFLAKDGRLAILDWSLVAHLSKADREAVVEAALGALLLDGDRVCRAVASLGSLAPDDPVLRGAVERALARVRGLELPGFAWLVGLLDDVAMKADPGFHRNLVLFRKTWTTLEGVIHDLAGEHSPERALIGAALGRLSAELPERLLAPFVSRRFDTHLSNADLLTFWMTLGIVPARYWAGVWRGVFSRPPVSGRSLEPVAAG